MKNRAHAVIRALYTVAWRERRRWTDGCSVQRDERREAEAPSPSLSLSGSRPFYSPFCIFAHSGAFTVSTKHDNNTI